MNFQELSEMYNKETPYGAWITPEGEVRDVPGYCEHMNYVNLGDAFNEGFISIVYPRHIRDTGGNSEMTIRFRPWGEERFGNIPTTDKAYGKLLQLLRKDKADYYSVSDINTDDFKGIYFKKFNNADILTFFRLVRSGDLKLYGWLDDDEGGIATYCERMWGDDQAWKLATK